MKHPALILLGALLEGIPLQKDGEKWILQDGRFGVWRERVDTTTGQRDEIILYVDMTLDGFVKWSQKFTPDELWTIGAETVLTQSKRKKRD